jgi:gliding motility-associated lipoprotein GldH
MGKNLHPMKNSFLSLLIIFLIVLLAGCGQQNDIFQYHHIPNGRWPSDQTLVFTFDSISDKGATHRVDIELSFSDLYPYQNLYLAVGRSLNDSVMHLDTLQFTLADDNGKWLGSTAGRLHQITLPYLQHVRFDTGKTLRFTIRQAMIDDPLKGIEKVGIRISAE